MIEIYLCDDEDAVRDQIRTALEWKIFVENYDMRVAYSAHGGEELLEAAKDCQQGVYFLDVDLKDRDWDGFRLGQELRRRDPRGTLVYITGYGDLVWRTFQYHLTTLSRSRSRSERRRRGAWRRSTPGCWPGGRPRRRCSPCGRGRWCATSPSGISSSLRPPPRPTMSFSTPPAVRWIF